MWLELDTNKDGRVSFDEFSAGMKKKFGALTPPTAALKRLYERVKEAVMSLDTNKDGKISEEELAEAVGKLKSGLF